MLVKPGDALIYGDGKPGDNIGGAFEVLCGVFGVVGALGTYSLNVSPPSSALPLPFAGDAGGGADVVACFASAGCW
jgi:hypothetical protein